MSEQLITIKDAAKTLAVTEKKVRELCHRGAKHGGIDGMKIDRLWRISKNEVDNFIDYNKRKG